MNTSVEYYNKNYGDNIRNAFIHFIWEIGQIVYAIEANNNSIAAAKITETSALLRFFATKYEIDLIRYRRKCIQKEVTKSIG